MSANDASRDAPDNSSKDNQARHGRDARKDAQDNGSTENANIPREHRTPTKGVGAFLYWVHKDTPLDEDVLARKFAHYEETPTSDLRNDPAPTWEDTGLAAYGGGET